MSAELDCGRCGHERAAHDASGEACLAEDTIVAEPGETCPCEGFTTDLTTWCWLCSARVRQEEHDHALGCVHGCDLAHGRRPCAHGHTCCSHPDAPAHENFCHIHD